MQSQSPDCGRRAEPSSQRLEVIEYDATGPVRLNADLDRDEMKQVVYLREVLNVFNIEGVDAAFVYTFARYDLPHRDDPRIDLD
ncbi:MAG: hypothetical protein WBW04_19750 [Nitrolancea sp.]